MAELGEIRYAQSDGASIAYRVCGGGPSDLLVISGFISNLEIVFESPAMQHFVDRMGAFARVILFDKRGMGLSDRDAGAYTIENVTRDAIAVLDAVGSERTALLGISEGGPASVMIAATHPERVSSMVLYGTYPRMSRTDDFPEGFPVEELKAEWTRMAETWGDPESLRAWAPSLADDPEAREWWSRMLRSGASPGVIEALGQMYERLDVRPLLGSVQAATLVLHRRHDLLIPSAIAGVLAAGIPNATFRELAGEDHLFAAGDTDALLDQIEEFLTGNPPAPDPERVLATVMFTDLVDSTKTAAEMGDRDWRSLLDRFERLSRRELDGHGGRLVKTTGDGLLATFDGPARAIKCAQSIGEAVRTLDVEMRAGIHTGELEMRGDDVAGIAVHIASRVEGLAAPGEVATTGTVADLVVGSELRFRDIGEKSLKGVPGKWPIRIVAGPESGRTAADR